MKKGILKRALALVLSGAMVLGGVNLPSIQAEAFEAYTWNSQESESGWLKVPTVELSISVKSQEDDNPATKAIDGDKDSFWHSNWHSDDQKLANDDAGNFTGASKADPEATDAGMNEIVITLTNPQDIIGITYLPRSGAGNGTFQKMKVSVSTESAPDQFTEVAENAEEWNFNGTATEKEVFFNSVQENAKKVKITVIKGIGDNNGHHMTAAEIGVLKAQGEIDSRILMRNAKANSQNASENDAGELVSASNNADGPAAWAFNDNPENWWHTRYDGTELDGEETTRTASPEHPVWIQTGFERRVCLTKLTYLPRKSGSNTNIINEYEVQVANLEDPMATPSGEDFRVVKTGNLSNTFDMQTIDLTEGLVSSEDTNAAGIPATHIRLVAKSSHFSNGHITARAIRIYESASPEPSAKTMYNKAQANSWADNGNDKPAYAAFDRDLGTKWHSNYNGGGGGTDGSIDADAAASEEKPIWIQTGFGEKRTVSSLYYASRQDSANCGIQDYEIYYANLDDPNQTPTNEQFTKIEDVQTGHFNQTKEIQAATFSPVEATHIRLLTKMQGYGGKYITASEIRVFEDRWPIGIGTETTPTLDVGQIVAGNRVSDIHVGLKEADSRYTVSSQSWAEVAESGDSPLSGESVFEEGKTYRLTATLQIAEGKEYKFTEISKPAEIFVGGHAYKLGTAASTIDSNGRTMTVSHEITIYDTKKESFYWDSEYEAGTLAQQTEEDVWFYQVKQKEPSLRKWINLPAEAFYTGAVSGDEGMGSWMQPLNNNPSGTYSYSKLRKSEITTSFASTPYSETAFAWKAYRAGYYKAALEEAIGAAGNNMTMTVTHVPADSSFADGEILAAQKHYNAGDTIPEDSRIAKMEVGDYIRFADSQGWATGFKPMVTEVTAKEYAQQLIADAEAVAAANPKVKDSGLDAVNQAKESLSEAVESDSGIEEKITALETALDALETDDSVKYESEDGRTGEQPAVPENKPETADVYKYMKNISIDVVYKINEGQATANANVALFTIAGKNDEFFTIFHNPQDGRVGNSSTNGTNAAFWSGLGADTVGHWQKVTYTYIDKGNGAGHLMFSRNGGEKKKDGELNANEYWPPVRAFISLLRSGTVEKVLLGKEAAGGSDKTNCTIRDFNDEAAVLKYVKIRSSSLPASGDNLAENTLVDSDVKKEYDAFLEECAAITRNSDPSGRAYTQETWNHFDQVRTESQGKTTEWEMLDAIDALTAAKDALRTLTATAGYVTGSEEMGDVAAEVPVEGDEIIFTATPKTQYHNFLGWYKNQNPGAEEQPVSQETTYRCPIEEGQTEVTLYAKFELPQYTVTVNAEEGQGTVTITTQNVEGEQGTLQPGENSVDNGTQITITPVAEEGQYRFVQWNDGDNRLISRDAVQTFTVDGEGATYQAKFRPVIEDAVNVAQGAAVWDASADHTADASRPLSRITDGSTNPDDYANFSHTAQVIVDLGGVIENIEYVKLYGYTGRTYDRVVIEVSDELAEDDPNKLKEPVQIYNANKVLYHGGEVWPELGDATEEPAMIGSGKEIAVPQGVSARYIKVYMGPNQPNDFAHIVELEAYGAVEEAQSIKIKKEGTEVTETELAKPGDTVQLTAEVEPVNATPAVTWTSQNTKVAKVDANGLVTAVAGGTTIITATARFGSNITAQCTVNVKSDDNIQTQYWDKEQAAGTLGTQTDEDVWLYQVKENDSWKNIEDAKFQANADNGNGLWISAGSGDSDYGYGAIWRTYLIPAFSNAAQQAIAYTWNAGAASLPDADFVKLVLRETPYLKQANSPDVTLQILQETEGQPEKVLKEGTVNLTKGEEAESTFPAAETFVGVAKTENLKYLRLAALKVTSDVYGVEPAVEVATAREYAAQYLTEIEAMSDVTLDNYVRSAVEQFNSAKEELTALADPDSEVEDDDPQIADAIRAMEEAVANLEQNRYVDADSLELHKGSAEGEKVEEVSITELNTALILAAVAKSADGAAATDPESYQWSIEEPQDYIDLQGAENQAATIKVTKAGTYSFTVKVEAQKQAGDTNPITASITVNVEIPFTATAGTVNQGGSATVSNEESGSYAQTAKIAQGGSAYFKATTEDGYKFVGWFKDPDGTDAAEEEGEIITVADVQGDIERYARFEADKTELSELLAAYTDSAAAGYTWESWQEFIQGDALTNAKNVEKETDVTLQRVSEAVEKLREATQKLRAYHAANETTVLSIGTEYQSREWGDIFDGSDPSSAQPETYIQVNVNKDQQENEIDPADLTITWSIKEGEGTGLTVTQIPDYPSKASLHVERGTKGTVQATVVTKNGAGHEDSYEAKCLVSVGYDVAVGYVNGSDEKMGSATITRRDKVNSELKEGDLLFPEETAELKMSASEGYEFKGWYKDAEGSEPYEEEVVDAFTYKVTESDSNAVDGVITFYAKFEAVQLNYEKLDEQIKIAENLKEEDYTDGWNEFTQAFEAAKALRQSQDPVTQGTIDENADALEAAISGLVIKIEKEDEPSKYKVIVRTEKEGAEPTEETVKEDVYNTKVELHERDYREKAGVDDSAEFMGWKVNGQILSTEPDYTFYIADDITLTPVYGEEEVKAQALMSNVIVTQGDGEKVNVKFVGQLVLPEGCKLKQAGLIWGLNKNADDLEVNEEKRTVKNASVTAVKTVNKSYQYSVTLNGLAKGKFLSAKVYMYYQTADGSYKWAFSDVTKVINSDGNTNGVSLVNLGK